ncbi:hypothetical protein [Lactobacillus gigeriorum]|uniref:Uncharacterized protein n=1 Tax=Lactobacillus gigeriorum DSM 23908 = CRBIP 24.85 TaxID=1423751 RepID=I7K1S9_9LACO|nr:hypothetical protein [Lactobacillus gigeriorum]KRN14264.1 hypothetical protein FC38_GL001343 [Lactobacillus gigeriorum DSM 23908 = CRBIP 24.85]CCI87625.1 Putative uncharacterized protein [Lactobacillus gigeriorum DSM 23908 = CRBIP 24.85]
MKIKLNELVNKIENEDYIQDQETVKYGEVSKSKTKLKSYASQMVKEVVAAYKHDSLIRTSLEVTGQRPVLFSLETNIINLPYSNYKRIYNFTDEETENDLNLYFETSSECLNVSGFRIDQLATEAELLADEAAIVEKLTTAMSEKLQTVREYEAPEKETKKTK